MPYDPTYPPTNAEIESAPMRAQFNGLKDLIDANQTISNAVVDGTSTLPAGTPATVTLGISSGTLHFSFAIPQGTNGADGSQGEQGIQGYQGQPGEVTLSQLDNAIAGVLNVSSNLSNAVSTLGMFVSDPPTQGQMQQIADKLDELILALRR